MPVRVCSIFMGITGSGKTSAIKMLQGGKPQRNTGAADTSICTMYPVNVNGGEH